jgi:HlyD family secretion protein
MIANLSTRIGQHVHANQVIATIAQPDLAEKVNALKETLAKTKADRDRALEIRLNQSRLEIKAANRQEAILDRDIEDLQTQSSAASEEVHMQSTLFNDGIVPKVDVIAAQQHVVDINGQLADRKARLAQLAAERIEYESGPLTSDPEFESRILDLQSSIREAERELTTAQEVVSPYDGEVLELKVSQGMSVAAGAPLLTLQREDSDLELVAYVPSLEAKTVNPGMEVQISPSTIKREEYGYMKGIVRYVFAYPATPAAIMREVENEALVNSLTGNGPVTEMQIALRRNPKAVSGLLWSSPAGPSVNITGGTLCVADVITRTRSPLAIAFRFLAQNSGLN